MFKFELKGVKEAKDRLTGIEKNQAPFATARTLTRLVSESRDGLKVEIDKVFDRPTPFTRDSVGITGATKQNLTAAVFLKDFAGKGIAAAKYLKAEVFGGERALKRFEKALQNKGVLPKGMYVVPGLGAQLDAYGNINRGQIVQILSYFQAFGEQGYKANMAAKGRERLMKGSKKKGVMGFAYFIARNYGPTAHLAPGIYKRVPFAQGSAIKPVFLFVDRPHYEVRLRFYDICKMIISRRSQAVFDEELRNAIKTAK
jgi:hypothetical protein